MTPMVPSISSASSTGSASCRVIVLHLILDNLHDIEVEVGPHLLRHGGVSECGTIYSELQRAPWYWWGAGGGFYLLRWRRCCVVAVGAAVVTGVGVDIEVVDVDRLGFWRACLSGRLGLFSGF